MTKHLIDDGIIEACQHGDSDAFRLVFETYKDRVYSIALCFFDGNEATAKDITQEVFIKVWRNLGRYQREIKLTTWMYKITTNQCLDYLKSAHRKRQSNKVNVELSHQIPDVRSAEGNVDDREQFPELARKIHLAGHEKDLIDVAIQRRRDFHRAGITTLDHPFLPGLLLRGHLKFG